MVVWTPGSGRVVGGFLNTHVLFGPMTILCCFGECRVCRGGGKELNQETEVAVGEFECGEVSRS